MPEAPDSGTTDAQDEPWPAPREPVPDTERRRADEAGPDTARPARPAGSADDSDESWPPPPTEARDVLADDAPWPARVAASPASPADADTDDDAPWPPPRPTDGERLAPPGAASPPHADTADVPPTPTGADPSVPAPLPAPGPQDAAADPSPLRPLQPRRPRRRPDADEPPLPDDELPPDEDAAQPRARAAGRRPRAQPWGLRRLATLAAGLCVAALFLGEAWWRGTAPGFDALVRLEHLPVPPPPAADQAPAAGSPAEAYRLGLAAYAEGRWFAAEEQLARAAPLLLEAHPEARLYLASTLLHLARFDDAEVEALAAADTRALRSEGWWLAVQARLQLDPPALAEARELLDRLVESGLDRAEDARSLRDAIDALR